MSTHHHEEPKIGRLYFLGIGAGVLVMLLATLVDVTLAACVQWATVAWIAGFWPALMLVALVRHLIGAGSHAPAHSSHGHSKHGQHKAEGGQHGNAAHHH
ncbi:MAG: hypothetical protein M1333_02850 [Patescibacteria group bacterium]|nr:hypothetical protein [Patescibacteria group bacterium]